MDFSNKTALITGSGQGVGEGIARALASYGANVCLVGRTLSKVESVANRLVEFDSNLEHTGSSCTDENIRVVINLNYFK